ncbi:Hypothetical protein R9X50_00378800 [Acrodontium crateriforme]|uniref:BZIP domain-containing protein n=1 Tax=Acrodontium crateriforme TaxID=150365 RepID=A0AAQ3M435_9PEZI|nr:Hypothetical protein R9X50_00378800 [Acrodontium crateriforme]
MAYNHFYSATAAHQFNQYSNFHPSTPIHGAFAHDLTSPIQSMELPLDGNNYFNYPPSFDQPLNQPGLASLPTSSASPPAQSRSLLSGSVDSAIGLDLDSDLPGRRSSSEEKESLTPAQSRRKAQNRAAQRAFRERKERHVRDLETKLNHLTTTTSSLQSDNERLRLLARRLQTENDLLRASCKSGSPSTPLHGPSFVDEPSLIPRSISQQIPQPHVDNLFDLSSGMIQNECSSSPSSYGSLSSIADSHLLSAGAAWDLVQSHPRYLSGGVDVAEVCSRLKKTARCDGMGPMFDENEVRQLIEEIGRNGSDDRL